MGLFGGSSKQESSSANAGSQVVLNSSGWVVGKGNAKGGQANATSGTDTAGFLGLSPIAWASMGLVVLSMIYFKKRKKA